MTTCQQMGTQRQERKDGKTGRRERKGAKTQRRKEKKIKKGLVFRRKGYGEGRGCVLVLVFPLRLCAFASLRSLPPAFPFEPLCSRSRVVFLWANRQSECFGEAVHGVGCRSGIDGMSRLSIAEDFTQTSDVRIGDLCRIASQLLGKLDGLDHSRH